jgi:hypothetical protein
MTNSSRTGVSKVVHKRVAIAKVPRKAPATQACGVRDEAAKRIAANESVQKLWRTWENLDCIEKGRWLITGRMDKALEKSRKLNEAYLQNLKQKKSHK